MKLQDPTAPFADVIVRRRRERAASDAECFRFGGRPPTRHPRPSSGPVAVVGASDWALDPSRVERTLAHIGALGGLLADLGYDVYAVSALPDLDARPSFVGWVGGDETAAELDQLVALDAPGLAVGATVDGIETWGSIEPDDHPDSIEFVRAALHEIRLRTDGTDHPKGAPDGAEISTVPSTVRPDTRACRMGQPDHDDPRNSSARARSGTERDGLNGRSEDS